MLSSFTRCKFLYSIPFAVLLLAYVPNARGERIEIVDVPGRLPRNTGFGQYSPEVRFAYGGLQAGEIYTLRTWLLTVPNFFCGSTQWCERTFTIDNVAGESSSGEILVVENWDVFDVGRFDWVLRLFNSAGREVAFTEQFVNATSNRAPVLGPVPLSINGVVGETIELVLSATDPNADDFVFGVNDLPPGATIDPVSGLFSWTPIGPGEFTSVFFAEDSGVGHLRDAGLTSFSIVPEPASSVLLICFSALFIRTYRLQKIS